MKLKNFATNTSENRLKRFYDYIDGIDFKEKYYGKDVFFDDKDNGIYIHFNGEIGDDIIKNTIKDLLRKYWKNFESGIDFHKYDDNFLIEIKSKNNSVNFWEFIAESLDDSLYFKLNTNFMVNL